MKIRFFAERHVDTDDKRVRISAVSDMHMEGGPMKTDFLRTLAACALVAASIGSATAQDIQLASATDMNNIYARLAELESRVAASNVAYGGGGGCGAAADACDECCDRSGFIAGGEALFLRAYESEGDFNNGNYDEGFRFWIGWQGAGGLGGRIRYFDYDSISDDGDTFESEFVDFEIYDAIRIGCNWELNVGGGLRYADVAIDEDGEGLEDSITGVGPVLSVELLRHIGDRTALYAIARESIVVGDGFDGGEAEPDQTVAISEIQLGLQVHREMDSGALLYGRMGWETQWYDELVDGENGAALMGAAFSAGIMR
jgi:hypothetical protein